MTRIFITRIIPDPGLVLVKEHFDPDIWVQNLPPSRDELIERARGVDGLLCLLTEKIDSDLMDAIGPQLKLISSMSVGVDHIDVAAATARGIPMGNTAGVLTDATADQAFALMLSAARRIPEAERDSSGRQVGDVESIPTSRCRLGWRDTRDCRLRADWSGSSQTRPRV